MVRHQRHRFRLRGLDLRRRYMDRAANLQRVQRPRGRGLLLMGSRERHLCVLYQLTGRSQHTLERPKHDPRWQQHPSDQPMDKQ